MMADWPLSCEHYLTNVAMNRLAWIGQAAVCYSTGVPSRYSGGWSLLTDAQQSTANEVAARLLNEWLESRGLDPVDMEEAAAIGRQVEIY
jgi:hypothetical protein